MNLFRTLKSLAIEASILLMIALPAAFFLFNNEQLHDDYINLARRDVVMLTNAEGNSGGTGFYVKAPSGKVFIVTNGHVCGLADSSGRIYVDGTFGTAVLAIYRAHDLCLVNNPLDHSGLSVANDVSDTENIYVLGHPLLEPKALVHGQISGLVNVTVQVEDKVCQGPGYEQFDISGTFISALLGVDKICLRHLPAFASTANILPGNSGSPVLNKYGHVVAVAFAGRDGSGRGYLVPLDAIKDFLKDF